MLEKDLGKERNNPEFSAIAQIYDKVNDIHFTKLIKTSVNSNLLKEFTMDSLENPTRNLTIKVRIDPRGKGIKPNIIINNHDGKEIIYMLKERNKKGLKYFGLGAPPQDIRNYGKAVKADFKVFLDTINIDL